MRVLTVFQNRELLCLRSDNIFCIEADGNYSSIVDVDNKVVFCCKKLKEFETELAQEPFFRINRKHMVNLLHIQKLSSKTGETFVIAADHAQLKVSKSRVPELKKAIKGLCSYSATAHSYNGIAVS